MARAFRPECVRCRYDLSGLVGDGAPGICPECGCAIERSLRRGLPGTPWQRIGGVKGWWGTLVMLCRRPGELWASAWIDKRGAERLEIASVLLGVASGLIAVAMLGTMRMIREFDHWLTAAGAVVEFLVVTPVLVLLLFLINWIARTAMRLVVRASGQWLPVADAQMIVGHVSTIWVLIAPCIALLTIHRMSVRSHGGVSDIAVISGIHFSVMQWVRISGAIVLVAGVGVYLIGVWTGARALSESDA